MNRLPKLRQGAVIAAAAGIAGWLASGSAVAAGARDNIAAQGLFDQARQLMAAGKFNEACPKLEESQALDPGSGTLLNLADCYEHEGRTASAWATFLDAAAAAQLAGNGDREKAARERAAALATKLPRLAIHVLADKIPGLVVRRDGELVGRAQWGGALPTDPGPHLITAEAPHRKPWRTSTALANDGTTTTTIDVPDLELATATDATGAGTASFGAQRVAALGAAGLGVAGVVVGTVFGLHSKSKHDEAETACTPRCDQHGVELTHDAMRAGDISTVSFIVGGVGLAAGGLLWFTAPARVPARVGLGPGQIELRGEW